jgi:DNA-binding NtrC family response regulator
MRILYLENHADFARIVSQLFLQKHQVTILPTLAAARRALAEDQFDLLICDYDVDDGKGDELVAECRTAYPELAIIAASSHDRGNAALSKAGAHAVCEKLRFSSIQVVIDKVCSRQ